jgi:hypothetical protein
MFTSAIVGKTDVTFMDSALKIRKGASAIVDPALLSSESERVVFPWRPAGVVTEADPSELVAALTQVALLKMTYAEVPAQADERERESRVPPMLSDAVAEDLRMDAVS